MIASGAFERRRDLRIENSNKVDSVDSVNSVHEKRNWSSKALGTARQALLGNPAFALCFAALALGWAARRIFFHFAPWLWEQSFPFDRSIVNPWMYIQVTEPDGAEPVALLALVVLASVLLSALGHGLKFASEWLRAGVALLGLVGALSLLADAQFVPPQAAPAASNTMRFWIALMAVGASGFIGWRQPHGRGVSVLTALGSAGLVLIPSGGISPEDAATILAPALRLLQGAPPAQIYMQYDYLPSLLFEAWLWLGGSSAGVFFLTALVYLAFLIGLFVLARRWFAHPGLAGPLLVSSIICRVCAGVANDVTTFPQVAPFRLDLWIIPVALALRFGVRHWAVGLALGLTCIFSRSIAMLYLAGYGLALGADFLAARASLRAEARRPWRRELLRFAAQVAPNLLLIAVCMGITAALFGSPISDAALLYRKLGVGQLRIVQSSFYWWLLPLIALTAALAFVRRAELGDPRGGALLLLVGLTISSSLYFFGRSHENNLLNLSAPFLTCAFLCLDSLLSQVRRGAPAANWLQVAGSSALVGLCAWHYSGKIWARELTQLGVATRTVNVPLVVSGNALPRMYCPEVAKAVANRKVYFFSDIDYWYYAECNYAPEGYMQPMPLAVLKAPLLEEMNRLLDQGYTIVLRKAEAFSQGSFGQFQPGLDAVGPTASSESAHYRFVKRK